MKRAPDAASFLAGAGKRRIGRFREQARLAADNPASEEAVHDLRVSIRRLLAWIETWEKLVGPDPGLEKARSSLEKLMCPIGKLRDAHVKRDWIVKLLPEGDPQSYLYAVLVASDVRRRERAGRRLLRGRRPERIRIGIPKRRIAGKAADDVTEKACRLLAESAREVAGFRADALDPGKPEALHRMRLAFKKYRYARELFSPLFAGPDVAERHLAFQTLLGTIHDCDVILGEARAFMKGVIGHAGGSAVETAFAGMREEKFREFRKVAGTARGLASILHAGKPLPR